MRAENRSIPDRRPTKGHAQCAPSSLRYRPCSSPVTANPQPQRRASHNPSSSQLVLVDDLPAQLAQLGARPWPARASRHGQRERHAAGWSSSDTLGELRQLEPPTLCMVARCCALPSGRSRVPIVPRTPSADPGAARRAATRTPSGAWPTALQQGLRPPGICKLNWCHRQFQI